MTYVVKFTARAERDLRHLYQEIDGVNSAAAWKWYQGLKKKVLSLDTQPNRCPVTPENGELRHLLYGHRRNIYRVIYRVIGMQVEVLHIRHGSRRRFK
jgi:plasmid stabilization system protein ParE